MMNIKTRFCYAANPWIKFKQVVITASALPMILSKDNDLQLFTSNVFRHFNKTNSNMKFILIWTMKQTWISLDFVKVCFTFEIDPSGR